MASNERPGGTTPLGKLVISLIIAALLVGAGYWFMQRPKAAAQPDSAQSTFPVPSTTAEPLPVVEPAVRTEAPQAQPPAVAPAPAARVQPQTGGSDDPYGNLSTKEKK